MGVTNGQDADETSFNDAFLEKNADDTTPSLLGLSNLLATSGPTFSNSQKEINNKRYAPSSSTISGGGIIPITNEIGIQSKRVISNGGAVTASTTPFGTTDTNWPDGMEVRIMGTSDTDTVQVDFNDINHGAIINGNALLNEYRILTLQWVSADLRWIEVGRNF